MDGVGFQIRGMIVFAVVVAVAFSLGGKCVEAQVHHVVGADPGWDLASDLRAWSSGRVFRVGDQIWLTYSAAQGLVAEVKSKEEYEACDVSNPIKMYTDGLHTIPLEREGIRYFVSSEVENCNSGLKLHVEVLPKSKSSSPNPITHTQYSTPTFLAAEPTSPSASARYAHNTILAFVLLFCVTSIMHLAY
ncbi:mavicyanin-like [Lotus japonicus]|uniref:mavicyanin-like n=1 Tax=Lotus japonicus TaxID=34305 RepID=UPI00258C0B3D|nr:mavicyanin-like [Lotus japonicus]